MCMKLVCFNVVIIGYVGMTSLQVHSGQGERFGLYRRVLIILHANKSITSLNYHAYHMSVGLKQI